MSSPPTDVFFARAPRRFNTKHLVLTPMALLEPGTRYTFEVRGVKDTSGADLMKFNMSFTTSGGTPTESFPVAFEKIDLPSDAARYTGLAVGPDHKLYAGTADGRIFRRAIMPDGTLGDSEIIDTIKA